MRHGRYLYYSWLFWLLVVAAAVTLVWLLNHMRKARQFRCPGCHTRVEQVYLRCPECGHGLKSHCPGCSRIVNNSWRFCPHCKKELHPEVEKKSTGADSLSA
jgi:predicted amidophosphoribosyltransferase